LFVNPFEETLNTTLTEIEGFHHKKRGICKLNNIIQDEKSMYKERRYDHQ